MFTVLFVRVQNVQLWITAWTSPAGISTVLGNVFKELLWQPVKKNGSILAKPASPLKIPSTRSNFLFCSIWKSVLKHLFILSTWAVVFLIFSQVSSALAIQTGGRETDQSSCRSQLCTFSLGYSSGGAAALLSWHWVFSGLYSHHSFIFSETITQLFPKGPKLQMATAWKFYHASVLLYQTVKISVPAYLLHVFACLGDCAERLTSCYRISNDMSVSMVTVWLPAYWAAVFSRLIYLVLQLWVSCKATWCTSALDVCFFHDHDVCSWPFTFEGNITSTNFLLLFTFSPNAASKEHVQPNAFGNIDILKWPLAKTHWKSSPKGWCLTMSHSTSFLLTQRLRPQFQHALRRWPSHQLVPQVPEDILLSRVDDPHPLSLTPRNINYSGGQSVSYMRVKSSLLSPVLSQYFDREFKQGRNPRGSQHVKCSFMFRSKCYLRLDVREMQRVKSQEPLCGHSLRRRTD